MIKINDIFTFLVWSCLAPDCSRRHSLESEYVSPLKEQRALAIGALTPGFPILALNLFQNDHFVSIFHIIFKL